MVIEAVATDAIRTVERDIEASGGKVPSAKKARVNSAPAGKKEEKLDATGGQQMVEEAQKIDMGPADTEKDARFFSRMQRRNRNFMAKVVVLSRNGLHTPSQASHWVKEQKGAFARMAAGIIAASLIAAWLYTFSMVWFTLWVIASLIVMLGLHVMKRNAKVIDVEVEVVPATA